MVNTKRGDTGHFRLRDNIRTIVSTTNPHFEDCGINLWERCQELV